MSEVPLGEAFSETFWLAFSPHYEKLEEIMQLRLTYDGPVMHRGGSSHVHEIRKVFHPQLRRFWDVHPWLHNKAQSTGIKADDQSTYIERLANNFSRFDYRFVPLSSTARLPAAPPAIVSLDILFLRSGPPGRILKSGDIDGRISTLFNALRMPDGLQEVGSYTKPGADEDPFYVLMQDDKLVGNVSVTSDLLLQPTRDSIGYHDTHDARVVINVSLRGPYGDPEALP